MVSYKQGGISRPDVPVEPDAVFQPRPNSWEAAPATDQHVVTDGITAATESD